MSRSHNNRPPAKDMYWFAHGGVESPTDKCLNQRNSGENEEDGSDSTSPTMKSLADRRSHPDDQKLPFFSDSPNSSAPSSLEFRDDRSRLSDKRSAVEERRKQLLEAEQERNEAVLRKHSERDAALEARRNAQRSTISFAFGSSVPRSVESLQSTDSKQSSASGLHNREENLDAYRDRRSVSPFYSSGSNIWFESSSPQSVSCNTNERKVLPPHSWLVGSGALIGEDVMSKSMTAAAPTPRGRRKNDLMPAIPYERTPAPKSSTTITRKRSVSMTRLDQLAQPRRHYVEANKANSTASSGASSAMKDVKSPTRPLSSASEQSGGSGRLVSRRVRSSPPKRRPVSIAGTIPDVKSPVEGRVSPVKKTTAAKKTPISKTMAAKSTEKPKVEKTKPKPESAKPSATNSKTTKQPLVKHATAPKTSTPKVAPAKKTTTNKKKADVLASSQLPAEPNQQPQSKPATPPVSPPPDIGASEADRNNAKRIISEEEAKAALAEKRRLAREQAEKEAELERQRQEEIKRQEEERLRQEEEEQRRMEEEHFRLLEEHRLQEEEKLRKAIEENERKEEEERLKREEELRLKAEQEKKAQEEAEKQRVELEEKLRKEEEERAERKKRLEKIMSRTRGKSANVSPSGSMSGSEQLDSGDHQQDAYSSGANSLESNDTGEVISEPPSLEDHPMKSEAASDHHSVEANETYEVGSDNESLQGMVMPGSETASQDNSLIVIEREDKFVVKDNVSEIHNVLEPVVVESVEHDVATVEEVSEDRNEQDKSKIEVVKFEELGSSMAEKTSAVSNAAEENVISDEVKAVESEAASHSEVFQAFSEEAEPNTPYSTSSDMKLPDPIYETTSEEGSVSSERHQQDFGMYGLQEESQHPESHTILDDVFGEVEIPPSNSYLDSNPFGDNNATFENQLQNLEMHQSIYVSESSDALLEVNETRKDIGEENISSSTLENKGQSDSNINSDFLNSIDENKENIVTDLSNQTQNPFGDFSASEYADKENIEFLGQSHSQENIFLQPEAVITEQTDVQNFPFESSNESSDITIIKPDGSNDCIGMISSINHDRVSNDLAEQSRQNELTKSNFEYSSMTESDNSSLDSNLSQVMPSEAGDTAVTEASKSEEVLQNGQMRNPFDNETAVNGSTNGDHFCESEVISNGHRMEISESGDGFVQLDSSKHFSSVDHSKNNIFDNVDAVELGKVSPDPFLAKGNSNPLSGNPFLLQEDQKPVLMTPDFFN